MQLILKPDQLEKFEIFSDFRRIDLDGKESVTKPKDIGFAARSSIQESRKNDEIINFNIAAFLSESTKFIFTILNFFFEKSLAAFNVVINASILNPHTFKFNENAAWLTNNCNTHIAQYLEK